MSQCCCLSPQEERLQGTKKVNRQGRERVYKILDRIQFTVPHVDIERARYFTESMRQTEGELLTLRWAKAPASRGPRRAARTLRHPVSGNRRRLLH